MTEQEIKSFLRNHRVGILVSILVILVCLALMGFAAYLNFTSEQQLFSTDFSLLWFDFGKNPLLATFNTCLFVGLGGGVLAAVFLGVYLRDRKLSAETFKLYPMEAITAELGRGTTQYYKRQCICLTDSYVIGNVESYGITILRYQDIAWMYSEVLRHDTGIPIAMHLILYSKSDGKKYVMAAADPTRKTALREIMSHISAKNPYIRLDDSKLNRQWFQENYGRKRL